MAASGGAAAPADRSPPRRAGTLDASHWQPILLPLPCAGGVGSIAARWGCTEWHRSATSPVHSCGASLANDPAAVALLVRGSE